MMYLQKSSFLKTTHMRAVAVGLVLMFISISPASARQASDRERMEMAVEIATLIRYKIETQVTSIFKTNAVELGPAAIEMSQAYGDVALADWHSADGSVHGQVMFIDMCGWQLKAVSLGRRLRAQDYQAQSGPLTPVAKVFSKLSADVIELEAQHVAYLKPARPLIGC
jgi:hypothetical protein